VNINNIKRSHYGGVSKQICQTIAAAAINLFINFYGIAAPAMPFGLLSQVCHTACSSFAFVRAATVSFTPLRSFLPSLRFITPRSQLNNLLQGMVCIAATQINTHAATCLFANQRCNTHWVPFRFTTSLIHFSSVQSTRCL